MTVLVNVVQGKPTLSHPPIPEKFKLITPPWRYYQASIESKEDEMREASDTQCLLRVLYLSWLPAGWPAAQPDRRLYQIRRIRARVVASSRSVLVTPSTTTEQSDGLGRC